MVTTTIIALTTTQFTHMNRKIVSLDVKKIAMVAVTYRVRWMVVSDSGRI